MKLLQLVFVLMILSTNSMAGMDFSRLSGNDRAQIAIPESFSSTEEAVAWAKSIKGQGNGELSQMALHRYLQTFVKYMEAAQVHDKSKMEELTDQVIRFEKVLSVFEQDNSVGAVIYAGSVPLNKK